MQDAMLAGEWLELATDLMLQPPDDWPAERIARLLIETFSGVGCAFETGEADNWSGVEIWPVERFEDKVEDIHAWTAREGATAHPILRYYHATGEHHVIQVHDVPASIAGPDVAAAWQERGRSWDGVQHQVSLPLLWEPAGRRAFILAREDPYTAQEIEFAHTVQRLLSVLDRLLSEYSRWRKSCGADGVDAAADVRLTSRQLTILELLAEGLTAAAIGRRLKITERTVHKHLEHIYAKLGVVDRLSAVLRAQRIGLLPDLRREGRPGEQLQAI